MKCNCRKDDVKFFEDIIVEFIDSKEVDKIVDLLTAAKSKYEEMIEMGYMTRRCNDCENCLDFDNYTRVLAEVTQSKRDQDSVKEWYYHWKEAELIDDGLNVGVPKLSELVFNREDWESNGKKICYLDLNVINSYIDQPSIHEILEKSKEHINYVYSPNHIFEVSRMNKFDRLESIAKLTENRCVYPSDTELKICIEEPIYSMRRIQTRKEYTTVAESLWYHEKQLRDLYFNNYNEEEIRKKVGSSKNIFVDFKTDFDKILLHKSFYSIESLEGGVDLEYLDEVIECLYFGMNILSYKCDNDERKYKSGLYDAEHLKYAWTSDFLVTNDKKFLQRAKDIYRILNIDTKVIDLKEYCEFLQNNFA